VQTHVLVPLEFLFVATAKKKALFEMLQTQWALLSASGSANHPPKRKLIDKSSADETDFE
jgi:hypothetical protein